jgi:hypothetical protein
MSRNTVIIHKPKNKKSKSLNVFQRHRSSIRSTTKIDQIDYLKEIYNCNKLCTHRKSMELLSQQYYHRRLIDALKYK